MFQQKDKGENKSFAFIVSGNLKEVCRYEWGEYPIYLELNQ